jgi:hypothetical protein
MKAGMFGGAGAMALAGAGLLFGADESIPDLELTVTPTANRIVIDPATPEIPTHLEIEYTLTNRGNQEASLYNGPGALVLEGGHEPWMLPPDPGTKREAGPDNRVRLAPGESIERVTRFKLEREILGKSKSQYVRIFNPDDSIPRLQPGTTRKWVFRYVDLLREEDWWKHLVISNPIRLSLNSRDKKDFESPFEIIVEDKAVPNIGFTLAPTKIDVAVPPRSNRKRVSRLPPDRKVVTIEYTITNQGKKPIIVNAFDLG